ncbi:ankyrin repeat domain-containing protein [Marispirochaeta sp.]|uniref:ankyrin repeat domain-containing protein n=1 Tax=Marispirochaeta sp. TaxID=2038653 RepID=UPI0029C7A338|nr:ankyrin repeat domain-containing protein [Marispirochaeta sp.]
MIFTGFLVKKRSTVIIIILISVNSLLFSDSHELFSLIMTGQENQAITLLKTDPSLIESKDSNMRSPLWLACYAHCDKLIDYLLDHGADPDYSPHNGYTLLHYCAEKNKTSMFLKLLRAGANPTLLYIPEKEIFIREKVVLADWNTEFTPLEFAVCNHNCELVRTIVTESPEILDNKNTNQLTLEYTDEFYDQDLFFGIITATPRTLLYSILFNEDDLTLFLLQHSPSCDHLLSLALRLGKMDLAKKLMRFNPVKNSRNDFYTISPMFPDTLYGLLFRSYDTETIRYFINAGYNPNEVQPYLWISALHLAMNYDNTEIFKMLLEAGADPHANIQYAETGSDKILPPLHYALDKRKFNFAEILLQFGEDINFAYMDSDIGYFLYPPILYFADQIDITNWLTEHGADPEEITEDWLINHGADPDFFEEH